MSVLLCRLCSSPSGSWWVRACSCSLSSSSVACCAVSAACSRATGICRLPNWRSRSALSPSCPGGPQPRWAVNRGPCMACSAPPTPSLPCYPGNTCSSRWFCTRWRMWSFIPPAFYLSCVSCVTGQGRRWLCRKSSMCRLAGRRGRSTIFPHWGIPEVGRDRIHDQFRWDLECDHRGRRVLLRAARRVRPRGRHSAWLRTYCCRRRCHDEVDRPGLGWQRDLARPGRRGVARCLSTRVRYHYPRCVLPGARDAVSTGLSRRRVRVSLSGSRQPGILGPRLSLWVSRGDLRPRPGARRVRSRISGRGTAVRGRRVRFPDAVLGVRWLGTPVWLRIARRRMVDPEDRGGLAGPGQRPGAILSDRGHLRAHCRKSLVSDH